MTLDSPWPLIMHDPRSLVLQDFIVGQKQRECQGLSGRGRSFGEVFVPYTHAQTHKGLRGCGDDGVSLQELLTAEDAFAIG